MSTEFFVSNIKFQLLYLLNRLTLGYDFLTDRVFTCKLVSEAFIGHITPVLHPLGSGSGNGMGIPQTYPCARAFTFLVFTILYTRQKQKNKDMNRTLDKKFIL